MPTTRSMSRRELAFMPLPGWLERIFIGMPPRSAWKPECISAQMERATCRARASEGQSCFSGKRSASVSQMASESHTGSPSMTSTGTFPATP